MNIYDKKFEFRPPTHMKTFGINSFVEGLFYLRNGIGAVSLIREIAEHYEGISGISRTRRIQIMSFCTKS